MVSARYPDGVSATAQLPGKNWTLQYPSLLHVWNEYYNEYLKADFPRIIVRLEDMLLRPREVVAKIAECAGAAVAAEANFTVHSGSAKKHGQPSDLRTAIAKSANATDRVVGFTPEDLRYAARHLDDELMKIFHYQLP